MLKVAVALSTLFFSGCGGSGAGLPESDAPPAEPGIAEIDALLTARRLRAALAEIDGRLIERPGDLVLLDLRVRALRELGLERQALEQALALCKLAPEEARFAYEAGELAAHLGNEADRKLAREQFATARRLAPDDWRPAVGEAALLLSGKKPLPLAEADALLAPFLEGENAQVDARIHHALVLEAGGDQTAALRAFEHALELDPRRLDALCNAARLAEAGHDPDRALAYLQRAKAAAGPEDPALVREIDRRIAEKSR